MRFIVVQAIPSQEEVVRNSEIPESPRDWNLTLQVLCDDNFAPTPKGHSFGWWGMPTRNEICMPFVLLTNGSTDFGEYDADAERFGETDFLNKAEIKIGLKFNFISDGESYEYIVKNIQELIVGELR